MAVPAISAKNWNRTPIIAHFVGATDLSVIDELSFADQVEMVVSFDESFSDEAIEMEDDGKDYYFPTFSRGPDNPYVVSYSAQEGEHRAQVPDDVVDATNAQARLERPQMPIQKLDFDDTLGIVLDAAERYYKACNLVAREKTPEGQQ